MRKLMLATLLGLLTFSATAAAVPWWKKMTTNPMIIVCPNLCVQR